MSEKLPLIVRDDARVRQGLQTTDDERLAKSAAALLVKHYPGHPWHITAMADQGVVIIKHPMLHSTWGYIVKLGLADTPSEWDRAIITAGGELLEIWNVPRGALTETSFEQARKPTEVVAELKRLIQIKRQNAGVA
jgi:hypothetical protein